jgi:zinc transport system permease protein
MPDLLAYAFMRHALVAAVLVGVACGIVGTFVVVRRIVFISGGISHAAFGGIGLGYWLGINPLVAVVPFSLAAAVAIGLLHRRLRLSEDVAIGVLWTMGMALGILFVRLSPGYAPDLQSYLFGNILTVPRFDLYLMLGVDLFAAVIVAVFYREFVALSFDAEFATVVGVPVRWIDLLLLCMVALSVVVLIRVVGIILVVALLTMPTSIARHFTSGLRNLMIASILVGIGLTVAGLWLSYKLDLSSGATIVLLLGTVLLAVSFARRLDRGRPDGRAARAFLPGASRGQEN